MKLTPEIVQHCRSNFPALARCEANQPAIYFDGPGGTQVPRSVSEALSKCLLHTNANHGGLFATSREGDALVAASHQAFADFFNADDADCVSFGQNMTSLTFSLSRALARTWSKGDEIVVTQLDHDANVSPWVLAARDAGVIVKMVKIKKRDCRLDQQDLAEKITRKTRLVAVGAASNSVGTINNMRRVARWAHKVGALCFVDAVHYAPHRLIDVQKWDCDFVACSAYKFFGPHVGVLWGKRALLEELQPYKVRPATNELPGKWMQGTQSHEAIVGAHAAVEYLADLGRQVSGQSELSRREALIVAYDAIAEYELELLDLLLEGLREIPEVKVWGITNPAKFDKRVATVSFTHARYTAQELAQRLGDQGIFTWHGNYYALNLSEALGLEPDGMLRVGLLHYNTEAEVRRLLEELQKLG